MVQIITTSSTTPGNNITAVADEFIFIAEGVTRASTGGEALLGQTGGAQIQSNGTLVSSSTAINLFDAFDSTGNFDVIIGATGSVVGATVGIQFADSNNTLTNNGSISGISSYGVRNAGGTGFELSNAGTISSSSNYAVNSSGNNFAMSNSGTITGTSATAVQVISDGATIINNGLIQSLGLGNIDYGVYFYTNINNTVNSLTNYGTISAVGGSAVRGDFDFEEHVYNFGTIKGNIDNLGGNDLVENGGLIQGDVVLGSGSDVYNGEGGRVTGTVFGGANSDTLTGGDLVDRLDGGANSDTLSGGKGADILNGGSGTDTANYSASLGGVAVNLQTGAASSFDAAGDVLTGIENLTGSSGADYLAGDAAVNVLDGGAGDDSLYGRVGADTLNGGAGNDRLFGGMDADVLNGGFDDDILIGGEGGDTLDGGAGIDTADYSASLAAVTMNLQTNVHSGGDAAGDSLANIERVIGTSFADDIAGSFGDNVMFGGDGVDRLQGRLGLDDLYGGGGNDRLFGGVDNDRLFGGTGNDMLYGGNDNDLFIMENSFGNDQIMDFTNGAEFVDVSAVTGATTATLNVTGGGASNVMVDFGGLDTIEFVGITNVALITEADFIF